MCCGRGRGRCGKDRIVIVGIVDVVIVGVVFTIVDVVEGRLAENLRSLDIEQSSFADVRAEWKVSGYR